MNTNDEATPQNNAAPPKFCLQPIYELKNTDGGKKSADIRISWIIAQTKKIRLRYDWLQTVCVQHLVDYKQFRLSCRT